MAMIDTYLYTRRSTLEANQGSTEVINPYLMTQWAGLPKELLDLEYNGAYCDPAITRSSSFLTIDDRRIYVYEGSESPHDRIRTIDGGVIEGQRDIRFLALVHAQTPEEIRESANTWKPIATFGSSVYVHEYTDETGEPVYRLADSSDELALQTIFDGLYIEVKEKRMNQILSSVE